jgi:hypothetical protein
VNGEDMLKIPITVVLPSMRKECIATTLASLVSQSVVPAEVMIIDDTPKYDLLKWGFIRQIVGALKNKGVSIKYHKNVIRGGPISKIRGYYFSKASYDWIFGMDDDAIVQYDCLSTLWEYKLLFEQYKYFCPVIIMPENEQNLSDFDQSIHTSDWIKQKYLERKDKFPFSGQWTRSETPFIMEIERGSGHAILQKNDIGINSLMYKEAPKTGDDQFYTKLLGKGLFVSEAISYHLVFNDKRRKEIQNINYF